MKIIDMVGKKFGRLTVLERSESRNKKTMYKCICDCGETRIVEGGNLRNGHTKSCGCYVIGNKWGAKNKKHGLYKSRLYRIRAEMLARCYNKNKQQYVNYGGRGITVCNEWKNDFVSFYNWATSNGYGENLTIDRIDVNGNYCPENCRWITRKEQNNNRRDNVLFEKNGIIKNALEWSKELNIELHAFYRGVDKYKKYKCFTKIKKLEVSK